jgi:Domain of unknown function (DUF4464)
MSQLNGKEQDKSEDAHVQTLDTVESYETYEDYLDSQVTDTDMYYLEDEDLARQLVELGYRGSGDTLQREEFEARKKALRDRTTQKTNAPKQLCSAGKDLSTSPFMQALANREELVRNGKLTSIIFVRDRNGKGQEVSGYIDYAHRLKSENFDAYFDRRKKVRKRSYAGVVVLCCTKQMTFMSCDRSRIYSSCFEAMTTTFKLLCAYAWCCFLVVSHSSCQSQPI